MESLYAPIIMEFEDVMNNTSGTFWSPAFEADSFDAFVSNNLGDGSFLTAENAQESRRKLAVQLLEVLESNQKQQDEPYIGWLEEPMDLEVFGQSLVGSPSIPLDETEILPLSPGPSSPLASQPPTPIQPASPLELYPSHDDFAPIKTNEPINVAPVESEELIESLDLLIHQFTGVAPSTDQSNGIPEDDDTLALLDSLIGIEGHVDESQVIDELAEFSFALMNANESELGTATTTPTRSMVPAITASPIEISISEPVLRPSGRKAIVIQTSTTGSSILRKPRKKTLKADDRRLRKKEQNKTAATRYRIKKKAELDILLEEEANLEERNRHLQQHHDELANEVRYLKKLMREVITGKRH